MSLMFEELDYQHTPLGDISLRKRVEPRLDGITLYEVKLNDEWLMSSLFTEAEIQLSRLGLAALEGRDLQVVVGGLGLGYTAAAALEDERVQSLLVVDVMAPVIDWHRRHLVPLGKTLTEDPRCRLVLADFFAVATDPGRGFDGSDRSTPVDAILLDIDHAPSHWLNPGNGAFYSLEGLRAMAAKLNPGGVFALWSNDPPEPEFEALLGSVFGNCASHIVRFPNPYRAQESTNTVYVATRA
ncbi:spermidine synthase [Aestuariirhabdus litorea]|uniref:Spermidine synthase n=1 Tax=Aestuariirhabdus litorea TaxID=2528527 RepID=A0A3P3VKU6_9GAMM|nr:spermidine synthase [Aestuariirhabdus litorea]RRJ83004.1 spermidine synthase [Aestuariirhabdus litorea]RWW93163.1 spermidine synthase [Endozoicomonadaceae bacterium GTF-13]